MPKMIDTTLALGARGPTGIPVVNNLLFLANPVTYLLDRIQRYPSSPVVPVTDGNGSVVVLRGHEAVKRYFTDNETFHRVNDGTFKLPPGHRWSSMFDSVLSANEMDHRRRRKLLMPPFHVGVLDRYQEKISEGFSRSRFVQGSEEPFDMAEEFRVVARINMLTCLLGLELRPSHLILAKRVSQVFDSMFSPLTLMFRWDRSWTPYGRWLQKVADTFTLLEVLIEQRRTESPGDDALSILCHVTDESGDRLTTREIAGELHGLFVAGYETTASAMIWTMLTCLAEQDSAIENIDHFINETQRIMPTLPISIPRRVTRDVNLGGVVVPKGAVAFVSALLEHRDSEAFPDPSIFLPDRWRTLRPSPFTFIPFGVGPRRCLGADFADLQVRTTIRMALERSSWRLLTTHIDYGVKSGVMALPQKPIYVVGCRKQEPLPFIRGNIARLWQRTSM